MGTGKNPKPLGRSDAVKLARIRLLEKHDFYKSWAAVRDDIGVNKGLACAIANGRREPSDRVLALLGIEYVHTVPVQPCPHCGQAPLRKRGCACQDAGRKRRRLPPPLVRLVAGLLASGHLVIKGG